MEPETDLVWTGPGLRGLAPLAAVLMFVSFIMLVGGGWLARMVGFEHEWVTLFLFWLIVSLWCVACGRWLYRGSSYMYRLTDRAIRADFGFLHHPIPPIALEKIESIENRPRAWSLINVGTVIVNAKDGTQLRLPGLAKPQQFIDQVIAARNRMLHS